MFLCPANNYFMIQHWVLAKFGTWVFHHEKMMYIHVSDSMFTFDLKVKFIGFCHDFMSDSNFC